ncbi:MAG TPA: hypothetical protein VI056_10670 [Candidatus Limnocylindria bacterium]
MRRSVLALAWAVSITCSGGAVPAASPTTVAGVQLSGDAEIPNKARMNVQMALLGMSFNVDTITIDGKQFTKAR